VNKSFNKTVTTIATIVFLSGCGFQPLYQQKASQPSDNSYTFTLEVKGNNEEAYGTYKFKQELKPFLSQISSSNIRKISINLEENFGDIGYGSDASILRSQGRMSARIQLYDANYQIIYQNKHDVVSSYTNDNSEEFSNLNAQLATRERLITSLAQDVGRDIQFAIRTNFKSASTPETSEYSTTAENETSSFFDVVATPLE
jgi:hypothetical protein